MSAWPQNPLHAETGRHLARQRSNPARLAGLLLLSALSFGAVNAIAGPAEARQDSLRDAIKVRLERIEAMRDSLRDANRDADASAHGLKDLESVISDLKNEIAELDITVGEDAILFRNPSGDIRIDFPEDWDEKVSRGIGSLAASILAELPDTLDLQGEISRLQTQARNFNWDLFGDNDEPERRIISDEIFSTGNDVVVEANERVAGNVVVLGADATILGEVDGNIVVVGGTLVLAEDAVDHGNVVIILGQLRRDEAAEVEGKVIAIGESEHGLDGSWTALSSGPAAGAIKLTSLVVLFLLTVLICAVTPQDRIHSMYATMVRQPGRSFFTGLAWVLLGHLVLIVLMAVLVATVIGIPLALLFGLAYILMGLLATGLVGRRLGRLICRNICPDRLDDSLRPLLLGLFVLFLPGLLGGTLSMVQTLVLPSRFFDLLTWAIFLGSYCFGIGALLVSRFGNRKISPTGN